MPRSNEATPIIAAGLALGVAIAIGAVVRNIHEGGSGPHGETPTAGAPATPGKGGNVPAGGQAAGNNGPTRTNLLTELLAAGYSVSPGACGKHGDYTADVNGMPGCEVSYRQRTVIAAVVGGSAQHPDFELFSEDNHHTPLCGGKRDLEVSELSTCDALKPTGHAIGQLVFSVAGASIPYPAEHPVSPSALPTY